MTPRHWLALAAILVGTAALYLAAGLAGAYIAADDFQWLGGGHTFTWGRLQYVTGGDRFYRPAADLWFAASTSACGFALPCHHLLLLAVHLANIALVFVLGTWLFGDLRTASLATLLFAFEPAYTQAVVWLSAITGVLCAFGYLGSLTAIVSSWRAGFERQRRRREGLAVALFALASFSHEAAVTLPLTALVMWRLFGPSGWATRRILTYGMAAVVAAFTAATLLANRRNLLFEESGYRAGMHAIDHAFDYVASLYVGPSSSFAHVFIVAALVALVIINRTTRFGVLWMLIATASLPPVHGWQHVALRVPSRHRLCLRDRRGDRRRRRPAPAPPAPVSVGSDDRLQSRCDFHRRPLRPVRVCIGSRTGAIVRGMADQGAADRGHGGGARRNDSRRRPWRSAHRSHVRRADRPLGTP